MSQKYVTKPVEIEALLFTGDNHQEVYDFCEGHWDDSHDVTNIYGEDVEYKASVYDTLHDSWISVAPDTYIIKGPKGEFYPCVRETFEWKYELVDGQQG
jgi:hypothetical protein